jgi:hypothetical protein
MGASKAALILSSVVVLAFGGDGWAGEIGGTASQACYQHYLNSTDSDAFYQAPIATREHVLDCIEIYVQTGHLPSDTKVSALTKKYDAEDEADSRAYDAELTRKLGHKPTTADYLADLAETICAKIGAKGSNCTQQSTGFAFATQNQERIRVAVIEAHVGLRNLLKDPDSAEFGANDGEGYSFESDGSLYSICGTVNAKNSFGGYTGMQAWVYVIPKNMIYTAETGATKTMIIHDCSGKVYPKMASKRQ